MKFRFCGELDCPDWVVATIATLSRISSVKMKLLCTQVANGVLGLSIDFDKVCKSTADAKYEKSDVKATTAALSFIFTSSTKHKIDEESLANELQQLGLPKESTAALCKVFSEKNLQLQEKLKTDSFKLTEVHNVNWQVDQILWSSFLKEVNNPSVKMSFEVKENAANSSLLSFSMSSEKFQLLFHELTQAYVQMEEMTPSS